MDYYEPDIILENFGIKTREEFIEGFVVPGKFHKDVPADVVKSFETVTHLLAYSYHFYPLLDEALGKSLLIMEMAIKLKATQLGITLKNPENKKGISYEKNFANLIEEVCSVSYLSFLKPDFERARGLRNHKMHPDRHSLMGIASKANSNSHLFINIINLLFSSKEDLEELNKTQLTLNKKLPLFKNGLFVLDYGQKILIVDVHSLKFIKGNKNSLLLLYINPIYSNVKEVLEEKKYSDTILLALKVFRFEGEKLSGMDVIRGPIKIYPTDKAENIAQWYRYNEEMQKVSSADLESYMYVNSNRVLWKMEKVIYDHCWKEEIYNTESNEV